MGGAEHRAAVVAPARAVATAWSPPDAPASWWLTAETFLAIARDRDLDWISVDPLVPLGPDARA
jgi:hypothetical protein